MARDVVSMYAGTQRLNLASGTVPKNNSTSTINGADVNLGGYDGAVFYIIPIAYTDGTHTFTIQESADNGSGSPAGYTTVATTDLVLWTANTLTDFTPQRIGSSQPLAYSGSSNFIYQRIGYIGGQIWVRCSVTASGVTTGASYLVIGEPNRPRFYPAAV